MLFYTRGQRGSEVCDPIALAREFQDASRIAAHQTQYQWADNCFPSSGYLAKDESCKVHIVGTNGLLQTNGAAEPDLTTTPHSSLFQIPYNVGFKEVDDTEITWTTTYMELVWVICNWQYIRAIQHIKTPGTSANNVYPAAGGKDSFPNDPDVEFRVRTQVRIGIDDVLWPGSGPLGQPINGVPRGWGMAQRAERTASVAMMMLPAGSHQVNLQAAQVTNGFSDSQYGLEAKKEYEHAPPDPGVYIGNRQTIVIRFAQGGWLGA